MMGIDHADLLGYAELTDPSDPYPAELVGQLARLALSLSARCDSMSAVVRACDAGLTALWKAYDEGSWEMNHDEDCPMDDTCDCDCAEAARLLSKASGLVTSRMRIDSLDAAQEGK